MKLFNWLKPKMDAAPLWDHGYKVKSALLQLEAHLAKSKDPQAVKLCKVLHARLGDAANEIGRQMRVDVTPLSGGTPKELPR
jgi:hypothetical protein